MADLNVVIDLGKSLVKSIWQRSDWKEKQVLFLEPEIVELSRADIAAIEPSEAKPENDAWLTFSDGAGQALGFITRKDTYQGRSLLGREKLKVAQGVSRCLAVIGAIAQKAELGNKFSIAYSILLPLSEWASREELSKELSKSISKFRFRGETYRCSVESSEINPEGIGLLMHRQMQLPKEVFQKRGIACLVMGHYNNSFFFYKGGQNLASDCNSRGFHLVVDAVVEETVLDGSNIPSQDLIVAIYQGRFDSTKIQQLLWNKVGSEEKLKFQVKQVSQVIEKVATNHWKVVGQWLNTQLGSYRFDVDELIVSGGAAQFFASEIESMFSTSELHWSCDLNQLVAQDFHFSPENPDAHRLADAYSLFNWLTKSSESKVSA
ncbi:MAG: hypothetical protein GVY04_04880 [Cyanobacteria bacterium]|jgi:hypothetical protein|nr:hypothetical protein [Cyanobacteria bacterium GSL.Bin1]